MSQSCQWPNGRIRLGQQASRPAPAAIAPEAVRWMGVLHKRVAQEARLLGAGRAMPAGDMSSSRSIMWRRAAVAAQRLPCAVVMHILSPIFIWPLHPVKTRCVVSQAATTVCA